ncbi:FeoA family protein [Geobacillus sp. FSL K6-0789]|uniref:Ferrous iron transport protein A n=1 Tax=Geobacillus stearothermophilus TaxID=1422 RepID=A0A178TE41_GEOSE|nr:MULTISPECIES: FeoA family protein [Geobacillus]KAF6511406.1 Ferrous iron transport protein A [Geobacillus stearothermophilus]KMY63243.1 iron transporter FeoA [Geobacillus stearothermophilus]MBR2516226.1 ferrous iron transport protein A [Geobacillus sp.]OAO79589.1 Ferrous iron transport protein A [Geobacillus stearothermophilus]RLQ02133.1 ferrous iron transport protein A [Geobacillus stearothermophilus]
MTKAKHCCLSNMKPGDRFRIEKVDVPDPILKRRLLDLGFVPGGEVKVGQRSPLGDPTAYRVCGTTIALRKEESDYIYGEKIHHD